MGVYIKGMEMPADCNECQFLGRGYGGQWWCLAIDDHISVYEEQRNENCPLVPVPPHGRLIDADALEEEIIKNIKQYAYEADGGYYLAEDALESVQFAPTIIEAEEGE